MAMNSMYELRGCYDLEHVKHPSEFQLSEANSRRLKHGYYASVSFVDACFGKLMQGLDELGIADNTIVVLWGDHGWKLGEHGSWCKQSNYDIDIRVPLIIRVPNHPAAGSKTEAIVELVDLYPTVCDSAGLPIPDIMEGESAKPLFAAPIANGNRARSVSFIAPPESRLTRDVTWVRHWLRIVITTSSGGLGITSKASRAS